jgi:CheY-like chemotaxis protein
MSKLILVVEDNYQWLRAIMTFLEPLGSELGLTVQGTQSGAEALQRLRSERFALLVVDINLTERHPLVDGQLDRSVPGFEGSDLIEYAARRKTANGVIVISSLLAESATIKLVKQNAPNRDVLTVTPAEYLNELFPSRSLFLAKVPGMSPDECVESYRNVVTVRLLRGLSNPQAIKLPPPYQLERDDSIHPPLITIRSASHRNDNRPVKRPEHRWLLEALGFAKQNKLFLSDRDVKQYYQEYRSATSAVDTLRKDLRAMGVESHHLIAKPGRIRGEGKKASGHMWTLAEGVKLRGWSPVKSFGINPDLLGFED